MGSTALIATETLDAIVAETIASPTREVCGLLLGKGDRIAAHLPARNVADKPDRAFEIDPATLLAAYRRQRTGGPPILGCYHSHPTGSAEPSVRDAAEAQPNGWLWLIVTPSDAKLWRATLGGALHGRFDPIRLACVDGPHPSEDPLSPQSRSLRP